MSILCARKMQLAENKDLLRLTQIIQGKQNSTSVVTASRAPHFYISATLQQEPGTPDSELSPRVILRSNLAFVIALEFRFIYRKFRTWRVVGVCC